MTSGYRDRAGRPLPDARAWADLWEQWDYRRVQEDRLANGRRVITVWEGMELLPGAMYWTAVQDPAGQLLEEWPADSEDAALAQHARMVAKHQGWSN